MNRVEEPAGQTPDDGAVDADVLEIVARVLLDESHGALGAEREHTVLDEPGDPLVVVLDDLEHPGFGVCDCDWLVAGATNTAARARRMIESSATRARDMDTS